MPIAIFGMVHILPGVVQFWGLVSDHVRTCPMAFHKACLGFIDYFQEKHKLRRAQMTVRCDFPEGFRWAELLGFQKEGVMRQYGPDGSDYAMFGRIWA